MGRAAVCNNYLWNPAEENCFVLSVPLTPVYLSRLFQYNLFIYPLCPTRYLNTLVQL